MFRGRFMETRLTILENISSLNRVGRDEWRLKKIVPIWHGIWDSILLRWILEGVLLISIQVNWWKTKLRCNKLKSSSVNCVCVTNFCCHFILEKKIVSYFFHSPSHDPINLVFVCFFSVFISHWLYSRSNCVLSSFVAIKNLTDYRLFQIFNENIRPSVCVYVVCVIFSTL